MDIIHELTNEAFPDIIRWRRQIHANPELTGEEEQTAAYVAETLRGIGLEPRTGIGGHGITALISGNRPGKCIGLRADMDALPIREETGLPFASCRNGVMHACGHDCHTAMLLGAAKVFQRLDGDFPGSVKLLFQPAEEDPARSGAKAMIQDGVLENPHVDAVIGQHMEPALPTGSFLAFTGASTAGSDRFFIEIRGKNAHGSAPDAGTDAIVIASQVISALQCIISREVSPLKNSVLTIGKIHGGERYNVIASTVMMEGTCRNTDPSVRDGMAERMERVIRGVTESMGGSYSFQYIRGYSPVFNDLSMTELLFSVVEKELDGAKAVRPTTPKMVGEDFSHYSEKTPAVLWWLGCRKPDAPASCAGLHSGKFDPDERALAAGAECMVKTALRYLHTDSAESCGS